jgi:hypothetical protein
MTATATAMSTRPSTSMPRRSAISAAPRNNGKIRILSAGERGAQPRLSSERAVGGVGRSSHGGKESWKSASQTGSPTACPAGPTALGRGREALGRCRVGEQE